MIPTATVEPTAQPTELPSILPEVSASPNSTLSAEPTAPLEGNSDSGMPASAVYALVGVIAAVGAVVGWFFVRKKL